MLGWIITLLVAAFVAFIGKVIADHLFPQYATSVALGLFILVILVRGGLL